MDVLPIDIPLNRYFVRVKKVHIYKKYLYFGKNIINNVKGIGKQLIYIFWYVETMLCISRKDLKNVQLSLLPFVRLLIMINCIMVR